MLGIAWMVSLGVVFVLGILSAFAMHQSTRSPGTAQGMGTDERAMLVAIEHFSGMPVELATLMNLSANELPEVLEAALRGLLREPDSMARQAGFHWICEGLPSRWVLGSIRFLSELPDSPSRTMGLEILMHRWGTEDGRSAVAFSSRLSSARDRNLLLSASLSGWAQYQPKQAWDWAVQRSQGPTGVQRFLRPVAIALTRKDISVLLEFLRQPLPDGSGGILSQAIIETLLEKESPEAATQWISAFPEPLQAPASLSLAGIWSSTNPERAMEYLRRTVGLVPETVEPVFTEWAYDDGPAAAQFIRDYAEPSSGPELMQIVSEAWVSGQGPASMARWLIESGPGPYSDPMVETLVMETMASDIPTAMDWARTATNPVIREELEILVGQAWLEQSGSDAFEEMVGRLTTQRAREFFLGSEFDLDLP